LPQGGGGSPEQKAKEQLQDIGKKLFGG
jgi:hypothetical protein